MSPAIKNIAVIVQKYNQMDNNEESIATEILALFKPWHDKLLEVNDFLKDNAPFDPEIDELLVGEN